MVQSKARGVHNSTGQFNLSCPGVYISTGQFNPSPGVYISTGPSPATSHVGHFEKDEINVPITLSAFRDGDQGPSSQVGQIQSLLLPAQLANSKFVPTYYRYTGDSFYLSTKFIFK